MIKPAPDAPALQAVEANADCSVKLVVEVPEASTKITRFEMQYRRSTCDEPTSSELPLPEDCEPGKSFTTSFEVTPPFMPGETCEVRVRAHGDSDLCWRAQGSWSLFEPVLIPSSMLNLSVEEPMIESTVLVMDAAKSLTDFVRQLADYFTRGESAQESQGTDLISSLLANIDKHLADLEKYELSIKLVKELALRQQLRRLSKLCVDQVNMTKMEQITSRAMQLAKAWEKKSKPPPPKVPGIILDDASQHSLELSIKALSSSTPIDQYEVQVITLTEGSQKVSSSFIPVEAHRGQAPGDAVKWTIDKLEEGTKYAIAVRAYGYDEECFQRTKHWSPQLEVRTLASICSDVLQSEAVEEEEALAIDEITGEAVTGEEGYGEGATEASSQDFVYEESLKAGVVLLKALKDAAIYAYDKVYSGEPSPTTSMCTAIRKSKLVRKIAAAFGCETEDMSPEVLTAMELAVLFQGAKSAEPLMSFAKSIKLPPDYAPLKQAAEAIWFEPSDPATTPTTQIHKVFEVANDLDQLASKESLAAELHSKFRKHSGTLDKQTFNTLVEQAKDAIHATTGGQLDTSASTSGASAEDGSNKDVLKLCGSNPAHCLSVVEKAHLVRQQLRTKLSSSFPNLVSYQNRVLEEAVAQSVFKLATSIPLDPEPGTVDPWLSKKNAGCPGGWLDLQIVSAQSRVLEKMSDQEKQSDFQGSDKQKPLASKLLSNGDQDQMSKDDPEDHEGLALMKQKLILANKGGVAEGKPSKVWSELITSTFRHSDWDGKSPGHAGFNRHAQKMMEEHCVPDTPLISVPSSKPCVQPYQQVVSYMIHPRSYTLGQKTASRSKSDPSQRMLVVHRTGAGKTCSMVRIADSYFKDKRPKIMLFPSPAVCSNFYMELLNPRFPNRYAEFLQREDKLDDVRSSLELKRGGLLCGRVRKELIDDPLRPSAPLRAFSYTQAGGRQACGERHRINAVFKCPDGYGGGWMFNSAPPPEADRYTSTDGTSVNTGWLEDGYEEYQSDGNPFSNKIVLMDEFHNLVSPSQDIRKSPTRMLMLNMLKEMLRTAKNSVIVGFTATPLVDKDGTAKELLDIIKGKGNEHLADEGFISYFMGSPTPAFPIVVPPPNSISDLLIRKVEIENFSSQSERGNLREYRKKEHDESKALLRCSLGQHFTHAGSIKIMETLKGCQGKLCGEFFDVEEVESGWCPDRVRGYASKLKAVCDDVAMHGGKTLVLVHSMHGFKLMLRLLDAQFPDEVLGYVGCNPSSISKWDDEIKHLVGEKHNEREKAKGTCGCNICRFNDLKSNLEGESFRILVADAKFCSEGCVLACSLPGSSFFLRHADVKRHSQGLILWCATICLSGYA